MASMDTLPWGARALAARGPETAQAVERIFSQGSLFALDDKEDYKQLASALDSGKWTDHESAKLITAYATELQRGRKIDIALLCNWALINVNDADAVAECAAVDPPAGIEILRRLSHQGSQKRVFDAIWRRRQREVVLKQVLGPPDVVQRIIARELEAYPLNLAHPNIIETHALYRGNEVFLVEHKLSEVLGDSSPDRGLHETANLLYDIASALKCIHEYGLVHGDVKPANIGRREDDYVLLDFGICRKREMFRPEVTPTGSIRTRAPELLQDRVTYEEPEKADVWALGATAFNLILRRYPLIRPTDKIPRVSTPEERKEFEAEVARRADGEYEDLVTRRIADAPKGVQALLGAMLQRDVTARAGAGQVLRMIEHDLPALLRSRVESGVSLPRFSPTDTLNQISAFLLDDRVARMLPANKRQRLRATLTHLQSLPGFDDRARDTIKHLLTKLEV